MLKRRRFSIAFMAISLVLMALSNGIPMTFSMGLTENKTVYYSYFSRIPYGCGNIFPMITAGLSIIIVVLVAAGYNHSLRRNGFVACLVVPVSYGQMGFSVFLLHLAVLVNLWMESLLNRKIS